MPIIKAPRRIITQERTDTKDPNTKMIIAVDGEGWNIPLSDGITSANPAVTSIDAKTGYPRGWHSYVMLAAADDRGFSRSVVHDGSKREALTLPNGDPVARNYGLTTAQCLDFLLDLPPRALVTSFAFSYDSTKIGADLPLSNIAELSNEIKIPADEYLRRVTEASDIMGKPIEDIVTLKMNQFSYVVDLATTIYAGRYWIHYIPRKELEIIDLAAGKVNIQDMRGGKPVGRPERRWARRVTVWDGFGYYQKSFVAALKDYRCGQCKSCRTARECCKGKCANCAANNYCLTAPWTPNDISHIEEMKSNRGVFKPNEQAEVLAYCQSECRYLSFLTRDLLTGIYQFNPDMSGRMKRFDGSGAVASAFLTTYKIKDHLPIRKPGTLETNRANGGHHCKTCETKATLTTHCAYCGSDFPDGNAMTDHMEIGGCILYPADIQPTSHSGLPEWVALSGYMGGRFEVPEIGYVGDLYGYDINSAYPHITRDLPCTVHGEFKRVNKYIPGAFGIYLCGSRTTGNFSPFPFRTNDVTPDGIASSAIYYAHGGKRWVWSNGEERHSEVAIALKHFGADAIPIYDGYVWESTCAANGCDGKPFRDIPELYEARKEYVKQGNGIEKVIKLILNSLYGKTAQSIGGGTDKEGNYRAPAFQCFIWAGLITSGCRAMILDALMQPDADVVSIATDGILSRTRIASVDANAPKDKILGAWEYGDVYDGYLFQSGVYTYLVPDKYGKLTLKDGRPAKRVYKTRGFSSKEIEATVLIDAWEAGTRTVHASPEHSRFIPMRGGVSRTDALDYIGQWIPSIHDVSFTHNRRIPVTPIDEYGDIASGLERYSHPCVMGCKNCKSCHTGNAHLCDNPPLSALYEPKQTWEDVLDSQPDPADLDYMEVDKPRVIRE